MKQLTRSRIRRSTHATREEAAESIERECQKHGQDGWVELTVDLERQWVGPDDVSLAVPDDLKLDLIESAHARRASQPKEPERRLRADAAARRHPWLRTFVGHTPIEAAKLLAAELHVTDRWLAPLRDAIAHGRVVSLIAAREGAYLEILPRGVPYELLVAKPLGLAAAKRAAKKLHLDDGHPLIAFLAAFDGLRDARLGQAGAFEAHDVITTADRARQRGTSVLSTFDPEELKGWGDALVVYESPSGDLLLLHPRGPIAWARHDSLEIEPCGRSFRAALAEVIPSLTR